MSLFSVFLALLLEQLKPLHRGVAVYRAMTTWSRWVGRNFDAGQARHAWVVWTVTAVLPAVVAWVVFAFVTRYSVLFGLAWNVAVLYLTLGFRQFSHFFSGIRDALERDDELEARRLLSEWRHLDASELPRTELLRHVIEHSLLAAHRNVFGVFFWFVVLSAIGLGPAGAVIYRTAEFASRYRADRSSGFDESSSGGLADMSAQIFQAMDHLPARLTAFGFAVVGNFEESVNCWRRDAKLWAHLNEGVVLASAAGAVGVRLGGDSAPLMATDYAASAAQVSGADNLGAQGSTTGMAPVLGHLRSVVGLVWRSVVLWMLLLALLTLANLIG
jgi:adenosylcobinamide-phosphate synthase